MIFEIDGVDITPFIANGGLKWQRSDVDGEGAGRDLSGDLRRNRVATKRRWDVTCRPLTKAEAQIVLGLLMPEWVTVRCDDPEAGLITYTMYANNHPASFLLKQPDGTEYWGGITFPLVER